MFVARLMRPEDVTSVNALRVAGYAGASWFHMKDAESVHVSRDYPNTSVLVVSPVQRQSEVVATMAATMNYTRGELEDTLGACLDGVPVQLPVMSLVRLSVHEEYRGLALNHMLRKICVEAAAELATEGRVMASCGSQSAGTPNVPAMKAIGYEYYPVQPQRLKHVTLDEGALLAYVLPAEKFEGVVANMDSLLARKGVSFEWSGPRLAKAWEDAGMPALA